MILLRRTTPFLVAVMAVMIAADGCQLFVDLDGLEDHSCPPNWKPCPDGCAKIDDPSHGCGNLGTCNPCPAPHAVAMCDETYRCSLLPNSCLGDWANCDGASGNGCETDLAHDALNCRVCKEVCETPLHGVAGCSNKACGISRCLPGWEDCNDQVPGCETPVGGTNELCACGITCAEGTHCDQGFCRADSDGG